jgi:glyoxylase-like metal-dependent hydrolase (beta-lactamase superfamily II)
LKNTPPESYELEISLFGPGIGESIVAHLGDGDWIVVDSCKDRKSRQPVALQYLNSLGVDVANKVKLVVATHWHDDHIKGLAEVLRAAEKAEFVSSAAYLFRDLVRIVKVGAEVSLSPATKEFGEIIELLLDRKKPANA